MKVKKNDFILIGIILIIALGIFVGYKLTIGKGEGTTVLITVDNEEYARVDLHENASYLIRVGSPIKRIDNDFPTGIPKAYNILTIENGEANMVEASCPDKLCVHQAKISHKGEQIVCLPNKVVVEVIDGEAGDVDVVAN